MRTMSITMLLVALCCGVSAVAQTTRSVQVSGTGEVRAEPDRAIVTLGFESRQPQLAAARANVTRGIEALLKLTRELNIDAKDVRTMRLTVQPEYDWSNPAQRKLIGYYVLRQAEVIVRDLEQLGLLLERAVSLGANQVGDPRLESSKQRELERQAMKLAVDDARLNADAVARAAGATLGAVRTIDTSVAYTPVPYPMESRVMLRAAASDSDRAATYQPGQLTFTATVRVQYDLKVGGER